jgi:hypothetical protein
MDGQAKRLTDTKTASMITRVGKAVCPRGRQKLAEHICTDIGDAMPRHAVRPLASRLQLRACDSTGATEYCGGPSGLPRCSCGRGEPSPLWCRCERGEPNPDADVAWRHLQILRGPLALFKAQSKVECSVDAPGVRGATVAFHSTRRISRHACNARLGMHSEQQRQTKPTGANGQTRPLPFW